MGPGAMGPGRRDRVRAAAGRWAGLVAAVAAVLATYLVLAARHAFLPVSWDAFGYIWQTNAAGHASLAQLGTRPGVPALAGLLGSVLPMRPMAELVVLPIALAAALGLASAACVRMGFRLPGWTVPLLAAAVAVWPGTARILVGYEANLVLLILLAAPVAVLVHANGRSAPLLVATALFAAAAVTHVVMFGAFAGVCGLWVVLSLRAFVRDRRAGRSVLATDAGAVVATVGGGALVGVGAAFGLSGLRLSNVVNAQPVSFLFQGRTVEEVIRERPGVSGPLGVLGAAAVWRSRLEPGRVPEPEARPARALSRLALAWLAVAAAGVALSLRGHQVPGARFLLFALPIPVLVGLGVAALAAVLAGPGRSSSAPRPWPARALLARALLAGAVAALVIAGLAFPGWRYIRSQASPL